MNDSLTQLRAKVDAARTTHDRAKEQWCDKKSAAAAANAVLTAEKYERAVDQSRGGPRSAAGFVPPKTAKQLAADAATAALDRSEIRMNDAARAMSAAQAALLFVENQILSRWRNSLARTIRQGQSEGWPDEIVAPLIADLKLMCPPDTAVRLHQRFTLSALVRDLLDETPDVLRVNTSVSE